MELPAKLPANFGSQDARYTIKTKSLSYKLSCRTDDFCWLFWKEVPTNTYILKDVNCEAKPGEIMAVAGPSGAGKTTLLDILAGMIPLSRVSGHVLVNELPMNPKCFRRVSGYVTQDDALFPLLTTEEALMYSARLRLSGGAEKIKVRVRELLKELGLEHVANSRIGDESNRGISGGEKRRVSIGVDLVHDPAVLLLDEPTSGLDSGSALHVALLLKSMATNQGKTIVLTIHQPGFQILELFDQILLLAKGAVLHQGSLNLLDHRCRLAGYSIPRHVNALEFAIEVTENLVVDQAESELEEGNKEQVFKHMPIHSPNLSNVEGNKVSYVNTIFKEIFILGERFCINIFRTKELFISRTFQAVLVGFVLGTIFTNTSDTKRIKLETQIGFFAFSLAFLMSSSTEGIAIYLQQRRILMRETTRGAYRVSSYVISNTLIFLPFLITVAFLYTIPVYWLVGLRREIDGFLYFSLVSWMVLVMSNSVVAMCSALVQNFIMGTSLVATLFGSSFLFSGYFISKEDIPNYWIFMHYLSLFKYPFECFTINEYGGKKGVRRCLASVEGECLLYGDTFLMQRGLKQSQKWSHLCVMLGFIIGCRLLCYLTLWYRSTRTRN